MGRSTKLSFIAESVCGVLSSGIRVDAQVAQLLQVISADNLLFAQFKYVQCVHLLLFMIMILFPNDLSFVLSEEE